MLSGLTEQVFPAGRYRVRVYAECTSGSWSASSAYTTTITSVVVFPDAAQP